MDPVIEVEKVIPNIIIRYIQQHFKYLHDDTGALVTYMIVKENAVICIEGTQKQIDHASKRLLHIIQKEYRPEFQFDPDLTYEKPTLINYNAFHEQDRLEREKWDAMPPVVKNIYLEHPQIQMFPQSEVDKFRLEQNNISVSMPFNPEMTKEELDKIVPKPIIRFDHAFPLGTHICEMLTRRFSKPSPIQAQSWPVILSGHDMIGVAQTGTGKTLAFILPAILHIDAQPKDPPPKGPRVLVLSPTRELALQIVEEINKIGSDKKCICVYGGDNRHRQMKRVTQGYVDIVVATPGRLIDFMKSGTLSLDSVSLLILDEADRMLDLGFAPQIRIILADIRPDRQIVLTTATWPSYLEWLAKQHTKDSIQVNVGSLDLQTVNTVTQEIIIIHPDKKELFLYNFMDKLEPEEKCLIFFGKKCMVDEVSSNMAIKGYGVLSLHGGHDQTDREDTIKDFKSGVCNILLATDLASRGLDFKIEVVLNYDFPKNIEEYVHRVGRTGRAGRSGRAVTLMTRSDSNNAGELIKILTRSNQSIPPELYELEKFHKERQERNFERRPNRRYSRN